MQTATYLPQEHKDFLRQTLLDPAWTGERREFTPPAPPESELGAMTMEYRPDRDGPPEAGATPLVYTPGKDDAPPVPAAERTTAPAEPAPPADAPPAPADPDAHEAWKLAQKGAEQPPFV